MDLLVGFITLCLATILQNTLVVRFNLLNGAADLVLLVLITWILHENSKAHWQMSTIAGFIIGFSSKLPVWITLIGYLIVMYVIHQLMKHIWQAPLLLLFFITLVSSVIILSIDYLYLVLFGAKLPFWNTFNLVILPGTVLNLLFVLPVYAVVGEVARILYPPAVEL